MANKTIPAIQIKDSNVGIGTVSPVSLLNLASTFPQLTFTRTDNASSPAAAINFASTSTVRWQIATNNAVGTGFEINQADGSANRFYIDTSGNVGIGTTAPKAKLDVNGQIGFGSKSMVMTDIFAAALTINMNDHTGCYVKITAFGDWSNHSSIAYLGEFFLQASAGGYNEPGVIIRQVDNTANDDIQAQILDPIGAGTRDFIIGLRASSPNQTPFTAYIQYEIRGQYNSVN